MVRVACESERNTEYDYEQLPKRDEYAIGDNVYQLKHIQMKL